MDWIGTKRVINMIIITAYPLFFSCRTVAIYMRGNSIDRRHVFRYIERDKSLSQRGIILYFYVTGNIVMLIFTIIGNDVLDRDTALSKNRLSLIKH